MTFGSLFSGIGGFDLGLERAGMACRWQVENDPFCNKILAKHWPEVKRYGDITGLAGTELEYVDCIAGGFPCQDISTAGKGVGIVGTRSGLWKDFARVVGAVRPSFVLIENVPALRGRGLALVLQDLRQIGYDAEWHCIPACALGANHRRDRIWIVSYPQGMFRQAIIWGEPQRDVRVLSEDADADGEHRDLCGHGAGSVCGERSEAADVSRGQTLVADNAGDGCRQGRPWRPVGGYSWQGCAETETAQAAADPAINRLEERSGFVGNDGSELSPTERSTAYEPLVELAIARGERHAWTNQPGVGRMVHGVPNRVDRVASLGRVAVPQVVEWIGHRIFYAHVHGRIARA